MKIIVIHFELPTWTRRALAATVAPLAILIAFGGAVDAAGPTFAAGEPLSAAKLNSALGDADARLTKLEARLSGAGKFSAGGMYCGSTLGATPGDMSGLGGDKGYAAAKSACQATCDKSPTAHMCTTDEIMRSAAVGVSMKSGWFASGDPYYTDCAGFSSTGGAGSAWITSGAPRVASQTCATSSPVLCCDAR